MIWVTAADGTGEYFNSAWLSYTGSTLKQNGGKGWLNWIHPEDHPRVLEKFESTLKEGGTFEATYRMRRASDGDYRWHVARGMPVFDSQGHAMRWYGSSADIHDQRVLTENLRDSEHRLRLATQASRVGVWEIDLETRRIWRNHEHDRAFGYDQTLDTWSLEALIEHVLDEDRPRVAHALYDSLERQSTFDIEYRVIWPNQTLHWMHMRGGVDRSANGRLRMAGTNVDITERKVREQDLQDARNLAVVANETKTAFLANMSHEIRTPLSAIMGFTELIASDATTPDERSRYSETVQRNGRALMHIIDDILDLSKIEANKLDLDFDWTDLRTVVDDIKIMFKPIVKDKGLEFYVTVAEDVPQFLRTDPSRLRQILLNAISNACKFTERGSVSLEVSRVGGDKKTQAWICFSIKDTGIGITEEQQAKLFQPFTQADNSMTRRFGGTGLGLMLSRRLAKMLGGAYYLARSSPGVGSAFDLRLPVEDLAAIENLPRELARSTPAVDQNHKLQGVRILLVDDSVDSRALAARYLEREGAIVEQVGSARDAIDRLSKSEFDLLITDIQMPIMDGYELTRHLRNEGFAKPIIGLTAHVFKEDRQRSLAVGLDDHLGKPIKARELITTVARRVSEGSRVQVKEMS